ncbi:MAG: hypothetical protein HC945_00405, partial [Nitrosarchaeum sp.]|nr:hypothetical protein [Nitrosarchaeum sp.]
FTDQGLKALPGRAGACLPSRILHRKNSTSSKPEFRDLIIEDIKALSKLIDTYADYLEGPDQGANQ